MAAFRKGDNKHQKKTRARPNPPPIGGLVKIETRGRPTTYHPDYPETVYRLRIMNNTMEEIAFYFGVNIETLRLWCETYPLFNEAYAKGGDLADFEVAESLKHAAKGYSHKAEKIFMTKEGEIVRAEYIQHYPPSIPAASLWLSNRQRAKWKLPSSKEEPASGNDEPTIKIVGGLPDE